MRADGNAVNIQTEKNDLYIRSMGRDHDVVINPSSDDGKVGIGTANPTQKLEVTGNVLIAEDLYLNKNNYVSLHYGNRGKLGATPTFNPDYNKNGLWLEASTDGSESGGIFCNGNTIVLWSPGDNDTLRVYDEDKFSSPKFVIDNFGKVGIGTASPDSQLHVSGDRIRLENSGKHLDLRADQKAVDLQTETSDLSIRSIGSGHNVVLNPSEDDGKVGIGTEKPTDKTVKLHVQGDSKRTKLPIALIENTRGETIARILELKARQSIPKGNHFITFLGGSDAVGQIEGNDKGGVTFVTKSRDYAECLPRLNEQEVIAPAEIVGIFAGKVTKETKAAHHTAVVSNQSIVIGNMPQQDEEKLYENIAFLGQVPVKVKGTVKAGDYIIPSGLNDGTGMAISPQNLTPAHYAQIVGKAWESSEEAGIKSINTVVGLPSSYPGAEMASLLESQQAEIKTLRAELEALKAMIVASQQASPETNRPVETGIA